MPDLAVTFRVKSATPNGREMGAANVEDGTSVAGLLMSNGRAWLTRLLRHGNASLSLFQAVGIYSTNYQLGRNY